MAFGAFMAVYRSEYNGFLSFQFRSELVKRQINERLGATINQITNKSLLSFKVPMPCDRSERLAVAEVLSDIDAELAALEAKREKARAVKQGMLQDLLIGGIRLV
jgi:type I restriction enzyme, S subunit